MLALDAGDPGSARFLRASSPMAIGLTDEEIAGAAGLAESITFTGRLDHAYATTAIAALDVLVVPSVLHEAFGMVALEGTAAGALPLVARHSGLAEIVAELEAEAGEPGLLSYRAEPDAARDLARALERLLAIPEADRRELGHKLAAFVAGRWGWQRTADGLLAAAATTGR